MTVEQEGEITSLGELILPYKGLLTPFAMMTASTPPGIQMHCDTCHAHKLSTSLLMRPNHCGEPMRVEAWTSLYEYFSAG